MNKQPKQLLLELFKQVGEGEFITRMKKFGIEQSNVDKILSILKENKE